MSATELADPYAPMVWDDAEPRAVEVTIGGQKYLLKEASEDVACKWQNAAMRAARLTDGKVTGVDGVADAGPVLVAGCLFKLVPGKTGEPRELPTLVAEVRAWPTRITRPLFQRALAISGLDEETADAVEKRIAADTEKLRRLRGGADGPKGSPAGTPDTSGTAGTTASP